MTTPAKHATGTEAPAIRERGIIFTGDSVRAILDGRKTMTRRVVKPQPVLAPDLLPTLDEQRLCFTVKETSCCTRYLGMQNFIAEFAPYAGGDRAWVRETWKPHCEGPISKEFPLGTCVKYKADGALMKPEHWTADQGFWCEAHENETRWRPSIFLPRWASRITLEITGVRVERLTAISEADAIAEGCKHGGELSLSATCEFMHLWNSINGKRPGCAWKDSPWVWVIAFRRLAP